MALAAMGNSGVLMEPHIAKEVIDPQGNTVQEFSPRPVRRVMSQQAAQQMLAIMETVTQKGGTGTEGAVPGFTVAGKTGTAQKVVGRAYSHNKFNSLFIGMVPADKPVLAISVIVDEPKGAIFGGVVAAPIFREIAAQSLRVLGYYPQQEKLNDLNMPVQAKMANPAKDGRMAKATPAPVLVPAASPATVPLAAASPAPVPVAAPAPAPAPTLAELLPLKPKAFQEPPKVMPDLKGYTIRQVLVLLNQAGLKCLVEGSGLAVSQEPSPGTALNPGTVCSVKFQSSS
jgi:membrane peptidoglycan carboxypeptidase